MNILKKTNISQKAFTLVELVVTITILAILATIAFMSLQWYSKIARNSARIADLQSVKTVMELFIIQYGKYPLPDSYTWVVASGATLWYTWEIWDSIIRQVGKISKIPVDPLDWASMKYSTTLNQKEYQIKYDFELAQENSVIDSTYAAEPLFPKLEWNYNGFYVVWDDYRYYASPSLHTNTADVSTESTFHLDTYDALFTVEDLWVTTSNIAGNYSTFTTNLHSAYSGATDLNTGEYDFLSWVNLWDNNDLENFAKLLLWGELVSYACSAEPGIANAAFYEWTATSDDQLWTYDISAVAWCSWKCDLWFFKWAWDTCVPPTPITWIWWTNTNWLTAANWDLWIVPTSSHAVTIDNNSTIDLDTTWWVEIYSLELWWINATTLQLSWLSGLTMLWDMTIKSNGTVLHAWNSSAKTHIVNIIASSMTIEAGWLINTNGRWYARNQGPWKWWTYLYNSWTPWKRGGWWGWYGWSWAGWLWSWWWATYGSLTEPIDLWSWWGYPYSVYAWSGWGAVQLHISWSFVFNGSITANWTDGGGTMSTAHRYCSGWGSWWSIWIEAWDISWTGYAYANGWDAYYHSATYAGYTGWGGWGWRVAIHYTTSSFSLASHVIVDWWKKNGSPHGAVWTEYTQQN